MGHGLPAAMPNSSALFAPRTGSPASAPASGVSRIASAPARGPSLRAGICTRLSTPSTTGWVAWQPGRLQ